MTIYSVLRAGTAAARLCLLLAFAAQTPVPCTAQAPTVTSVSPPNWWVGHTVNPVRLLLRGANLSSAKVSVGGTGAKVSNVQTSASGTSLFCDLTIAPNAAPGQRIIHITTPPGQTTAPFDILPRLQTAGRFAGFGPDDVIYLIMPDRFSDGDPSNDDPAVSRGEFNRAKPDRYHGGDFQGIINHLPYLKSLGVTALWITPIYDNVNNLGAREPNPADPIGDYHGYGATDFYGVEEHFGTLALLRELVQKAHALGLKVIQDQVANHTSPFHPWLADPPTPTWYNGTPAHHLDNNWDIPVLADPHAAPALQKTPLEGWFVNYLPDLNQNDPEVARYEIQNTLWWLGTAGFDGVREDTMCYVPRAFWQKWSAALRRQFPNVETVGEVNNGDIGVASFFQGGRTEPDGIDTGVRSLFDFPLYYPLRRVFAQGQPIRDVAYMLGRDTLYADPNRLVTFLGLHDNPRFLHEDGATVDGLKLAQTFLLTTRGIPMLYYGDEIGMNGGPDPDNRHDFPGGWPGDPSNAFTAEGRTPQQEDIFRHVQTLTHLRQSLPALRWGTLTNLYVSEQQYAYARQMKTGDAVVVALNNDRNPATFTFALSPVNWPDSTILMDKLGAVSGPLSVQNGSVTLTLPARGGAILTRSTP